MLGLPFRIYKDERVSFFIIEFSILFIFTLVSDYKSLSFPLWVKLSIMENLNILVADSVKFFFVKLVKVVEHAFIDWTSLCNNWVMMIFAWITLIFNPSWGTKPNAIDHVVMRQDVFFFLDLFLLLALRIFFNVCSGIIDFIFTIFFVHAWV